MCQHAVQVSYRSMNLKDEPFLVEIVKDALCYVAADSRAESRRAFPKNRSQIAMEYVLPDGVSSARGHARDPRDPACAPTPPLAPGTGRSATRSLAFANSILIPNLGTNLILVTPPSVHGNHDGTARGACAPSVSGITGVSHSRRCLTCMMAPSGITPCDTSDRHCLNWWTRTESTAAHRAWGDWWGARAG